MLGLGFSIPSIPAFRWKALASFLFMMMILRCIKSSIAVKIVLLAMEILTAC